MHLKPLLLLGFALSFIGGLCGADPTAAFFVAMGTFLPACGQGGSWWVWSLLSISAWAAGSGVIVLLGLGSPGDFPDPPSQLHTILTLVAAFTSGLGGTSLNWAASRMMRQR